MNKRYKLFIFDFDGTLGDTKECIVASFQKSLSLNNLPAVEKEKIIHLMGLSLKEVFRKLTKGKLSEELYDKLVTDYRVFYREYLGSKTVNFPKVKETLKILKEKGVLCSIATSKKTELAKLSCKFLEIDSYLDFYIGDDMVTKKKPDPEMLLRTLEKFNIDVKESVMIGDSTFDIEMGNKINMDTIAVTWGSHSKKLLISANPTYVINDFSQLLKFFDLS